MEHRAEQGYSASGASKLISALSLWYCSMDSNFDIGANFRIKKRLHILELSWKKYSKVPRVPLLEEDVVKIAKVCPGKADPTHWEAFVVLAWVFLLRHKEALRMRPEHIRKYKDARGEHKWSLLVPESKTSIGANDPQTVIFSDDDIPIQFLPKLHWLKKQSKNFEWLVGSDQDHVKAIRTALKVPKKRYQEFCFHGTRHGRATWLTAMSGFTLADLMRAGRWRSKSSAKGYVHA